VAFTELTSMLSPVEKVGGGFVAGTKACFVPDLCARMKLGFGGLSAGDLARNEARKVGLP
jgi:hypothetical protein